MNPTAIYSKSGKGVQEAGGKTSHLSRPDRAVLSAIDGRATLADVAQKVGKTFDPAFQKVIEALDKGGFIREISPGTAAPAAKPAAGAKPGAKPAGTAPMDAASDLDFTASISAPSKGGRPPPPPQAPPRAAPPPPKQTVTIPPAPPPPSAAEKAVAERAAKEQQDAMAKAREEAERKAAADRERVKAEAEAKMRAETETKMRAEADTKVKEAEAKIKAAQEAAARVAAEAKAKAEAEAKKAREEAERARKEAEETTNRLRREAEEKAERARKEAEEKARREQEELKRKLEEERKAREEAERKAKEEARRLEEERRKLEEERKRHEEAKRREDEERASRRIQEERERVERKRQEKEEEERAAKRRARDEEAEEEEKPKAKPKPKPEPEPARPAATGGFSDSLLADLESFTNREETEAKEKEEAERKAKEEAGRRAREAEERRVKEEAERREREEKEREKQRQKDEAEARKRAEERELKDKEEREKQRLKDEEEKRKKEAEEREKKAKQEERLAAKATGAGPRGEGYSEEEQLRRRRERQLGPAPQAAAKERAARGGWGKPIAIALVLLLVVGVGVAHIWPIDVADYRQAAEDALGRPVKIGSARLSLFSGLQLKFNDVVVGETRIAEVRAYPEFDALSGPRKRFSRIEIDGLKLDQAAVGEALFAKLKGDSFSVARVVARQLELVGPLVLPKGGLEIDAMLDHEGAVRAATVRGPDSLLAKITAKDGAMDVDLSAASFVMPFAPEISLAKFTLKGTATPRGMSVSEWDGQALNGNLSGTANLRWGETWVVDGVVTARNIYAAVFAPALLSEGKGEGSGKFSMRGEPGKLAAGTRLDGSFTVTRGSLGSIDLSRAIQTGGKQATGRTQFNEMNGQAVYDRGAIALRNVTIAAGQMNAGASVDISQNGALSGRVVADVRVSSQTLRATLNLGGTLKEPQVRN